MRRLKTILFLLAITIGVAGCVSPRITLFTDASDPLMEVTLQGSADDKILVVSIDGIITDAPQESALRTMPSPVQEVVSQLRLAEKDEDVKAVLLKINTPGGTTTASDILYHEIVSFKQRTGNKVVACMMDLATSGGYYIALPADLIMAHPTTVTGSVGVILVDPQVSVLMEKIGVDVRVHKSGEKKDMGSPFRSATPDEVRILQGLTDTLGERFVQLVKQHRNLDETPLAAVATARLFLAQDALETGLVDQIGYLSDALAEAKSLASLDPDARVVAYRRTDYPDDNIYNPLTSGVPTGPRPLVDIGPLADWLSLDAGFYYIWPQALGRR